MLTNKEKTDVYSSEACALGQEKWREIYERRTRADCFCGSRMRRELEAQRDGCFKLLLSVDRESEVQAPKWNKDTSNEDGNIT